MNPSRKTRLALIAISVVGVFMLDWWLPAGVAASVLYVVLIVLTASLGARAAIVTTAVCVAATISGYLASSAPAGRELLPYDAALSVVAQLTACWLALARIRSDERERETQRRAEASRNRLALVNEMGQVFSSTLDLESIYLSMRDHLSQIIDCESLLVSMYNEDEQAIHCAFAYTDGAVYPCDRFEPLKLGGGPQSECIRTARPVIVNDIKKQHSGTFRYVGESNVYPISVIYVPMIVEDKVIGVIQAQSVREGAYTEEDVALLSIIASRAASAIQNARLYKEAVEGRRAMEHANRMKDEFLAVLSHELRTPLTPILGWTRILKDLPQEDSETRAQALAVIERNAKFQSQLVNDLLDMSRIESGKLPLHMSVVDLNSSVAAALESIRDQAAGRGIEVVGQLAPDPLPVLADPARLEQIISNLLTNAIKFTDAGGHVSVITAHTEASAVLSLTDTGVGIDPGFLPHIFERFRQADSSSRRRHGGLGLGLSIVKSLVEMHSGVIRAHSEGAGSGTTFTVELPLAAAGAVRREPSGPLLTEKPLDLSKLRLLVVEDDLDTLEMLRLLCEARGIEVIEARTAEAALALAGDSRPDCIVSDISMPIMDGLELARRVRADERLSATPIIAVTGMASDEDRQRALAAGFDAHIPKPIDYSRLFNCIMELARARVVSDS